MLAHEKLHVYAKALDFAASATTWVSSWGKKHALVDQLSRATESILLNLGEAARQRQPARLRTLDYVIGSTLECAACLDIAEIKNFLDVERCHSEKERLCEITRMLFGLRKAWAQSVLREDAVTYRTGPPKKSAAPLFYHESLDIYQVGLEFMKWFASHAEGRELSHRILRQIDEAGTSMVLNVAEGNGRFAELDHKRLWQIAQSMTVKGAVYLDLAVQQSLLTKTAVATGKGFLSRISAMATGF